jgi:hypothetical protein
MITQQASNHNYDHHAEGRFVIIMPTGKHLSLHCCPYSKLVPTGANQVIIAALHHDCVDGHQRLCCVCVLQACVDRRQSKKGKIVKTYSPGDVAIDKITPCDFQFFSSHQLLPLLLTLSRLGLHLDCVMTLAILNSVASKNWHAPHKPNPEIC